MPFLISESYEPPSLHKTPFSERPAMTPLLVSSHPFTSLCFALHDNFRHSTMDFLTPDDDPIPQWRKKEIVREGANSSLIKHILKSDSKLSPHPTTNDHALRSQSNDDSADLKRIDFPFAKAIESDVQDKIVHGFVVQETTCQCTTNATKETE